MSTVYVNPSCPISVVPNGVVPTVAELAAISVASVGENSTVAVLGLNAAGDGGGGNFYFAAGSSAGVNKFDVFATPTTGRWLRAQTFSGVASPASQNAFYSGSQETFVVLSGKHPAHVVNYYFPPAVTMVEKQLTIKSATTGTVTLWATGVDHIYDTGIVGFLSVTNTTGESWNFRAVAGRYYRIDRQYMP